MYLLVVNLMEELALVLCLRKRLSLFGSDFKEMVSGRMQNLTYNSPSTVASIGLSFFYIAAGVLHRP
jgi:hypothetical protein